MNDINMNLKKFINKTLQDNISKGLENVGQLVENEAKRDCQVDSGTLRGSINHVVENNKTTIGTNIEYAAFTHERDNPFLQNAVDNNMTEIIEEFIRGAKI